MFVKRIQPWQLGFTDIELQVAMKVFILVTKDEDELTDADELTRYEEERAAKLLHTMQTQYERLRIKNDPRDSRDDRWDSRRDDRRDDRSDDRSDDRDAAPSPSPESPLVSYGHLHKQEDRKAEKYTVPPEATREPKKVGRRAVRTR